LIVKVSGINIVNNLDAITHHECAYIGHVLSKHFANAVNILSSNAIYSIGVVFSIAY
jgi:hypothetical protein